jgi:uncharacterized protein YbjQ (UPF0145 family)
VLSGTASIGSKFKGLSRGELPELTAIIYHARENALELLRAEATHLGAERVIGNKLRIVELSPGLIEIMAIGTAVRRAEGMAPTTAALIPQALIVDRDSVEQPVVGFPATGAAGTQRASSMLVMISVFILFAVIFGLGILNAIMR